MGAYSPAAVVTPEIEAQVMDEIVLRTAKAMVSEGTPFRGVLFAGLMIKNGKVRAASRAAVRRAAAARVTAGAVAGALGGRPAACSARC